MQASVLPLPSSIYCQWIQQRRAEGAAAEGAQGEFQDSLSLCLHWGGIGYDWRNYELSSLFSST